MTAKNGYLFACSSTGGQASNSGFLFAVDSQTFRRIDLVGFNATTTGTGCSGHPVTSFYPEIYGMTSTGGGATAAGTLWSFNVLTGNLTVHHRFGIAGPTALRNPVGELLQVTSQPNLIYGLASAGGTDGLGGIFRFNVTSRTSQILYSFPNGAKLGKVPAPGLSAVRSGSLTQPFFVGAMTSGGECVQFFS
jgi:uncharacterized repeat protein (TIGR03803 family)